MAYGEDTRDRFYRWLATPPEWRRAQDLPSDKKAYAEKKGITARTLRRWEKSDEGRAKVREYRRDWKEADPEGASPDASGMSKAERDFEEIKKQVIEKAKQGNDKAIRKYFSTFGASLLRREQERLESGLRDLSDEELVDRLLTVVGVERVQTWISKVTDSKDT